MVKTYINSIVSKHFYGCELGEHVHGNEMPNFYEVLHDKLEELTLAFNLPIFTGFYTEYLDDDEVYDKLDDKHVIRNCMYRNEIKIAA